MKSLAIVLAALSAVTGSVAPSDLLIGADVPDGFESAAEQPTDLTFEEYAPLSPDATSHIDPSEAAALSMRAAVDVWTSADNDIVLREVTRWGTDDEARAFVEQAVVVGIEDGLDAVDPPFDGGVAFLGADEGLWTRTVAWQQGPYAMSVAHFGVFEGSDRIIDESTTELADHIDDETGHPIADAEPIESTSAGTSGDTSSGGIGIDTVLLWVVVVGGVTWLIFRLRRRAVGRDRGRDDRSPHGGSADGGGSPDHDRDTDEHDDQPADVDDIIERARARSRAEREVEAIPDPTEPGWTPPDDY